MSNRSNAPLLFGAAVVVCSGVAAYVAATLAQRDAPAPAHLPVRPADQATLESIDRNVGYLTEEVQKLSSRLNSVEGDAREALELAKAKSAAAPSAPPAAADSTPPTQAEKPEEGLAPVLDDGAGGKMGELREIYRKNSRGMLQGRMKSYSDTSEEGAARRFAQGTADGDAVARRFGLDLEKHQEELRKILREEWEQGAREIGPLVRDGLEKADVVVVRERLRKIQAETDQKLRPLFDDETWKQYEEAIGGARKGMEAALDEFDRTRSSK